MLVPRGKYFSFEQNTEIADTQIYQTLISTTSAHFEKQPPQKIKGHYYWQKPSQPFYIFYVHHICLKKKANLPCRTKQKRPTVTTTGITRHHGSR